MAAPVGKVKTASAATFGTRCSLDATCAEFTGGRAGGTVAELAGIPFCATDAATRGVDVAQAPSFVGRFFVMPDRMLTGYTRGTPVRGSFTAGVDYELTATIDVGGGTVLLHSAMRTGDELRTAGTRTALTDVYANAAALLGGSAPSFAWKTT